MSTDNYPIEEYKKRLAQADWYYEYAEGYQHQEGCREMGKLVLISKQSEEHRAAFEAARKLRRG